MGQWLFHTQCSAWLTVGALGLRFHSLPLGAVSLLVEAVRLPLILKKGCYLHILL